MQPKDSLFATRQEIIFIFVFAVFLSFGYLTSVFAQVKEVKMIGLGDSISEGVQSADANARTQPNTYLTLLSRQIGVYFPLPLIKTTPNGVVENTRNRSRLFPYRPGANLAVSGADVSSLLNEQADAKSVDEIDSETDLVLFPRIGSQMTIADSKESQLIVCWIGNNDVLASVTTFDQLDASQITPIDEFEADFREIIQKLGAAGSLVVVANIPSVTSIGFLVDRQDLITFLGSDFGLAEGDFTTVITMLLIKLGLDDGRLLQDPNYVLDAEETEIIQKSVEAFNIIIQEQSTEFNIPVVDINGLFDQICTDPLVFLGIPVTHRFLGGLFSLDGIHPSNLGHALVANVFIETINAYWHSNIPLVSQDELETIFLEDPFVDKDGDLVVRGRSLAGLLETLGPFLGISGDFDDTMPIRSGVLIDPSLGKQFIDHYLSVQGKDPRSASQWIQRDAIEALRHVFGLNIFSKTRD